LVGKRRVEAGSVSFLSAEVEEGIGLTLDSAAVATGALKIIAGCWFGGLKGL